MSRSGIVSKAEYVRGLERRQKVADSLRGILAILNSNLPIEKILTYIVNQACPLMGADAAAIYRLQATGILTIQSAVGLEKEYIEFANIPLGESITGQAILAQKPIYLEDFSQLSISNSVQNQELKRVIERLKSDVKSLLAVPIFVHAEPYGTLTLYYRETHHFSDDEISIARDFTQYASLAIDNAQLRFQGEQDAVFAERNRLARELHDSVTQNLFSVNLIADVLPAIWKRDQGQGEDALHEIQLLARGALAEMRSLLLELRPNALGDAHIEVLLTQLAEATSGRLRKNVDLQIFAQAILPEDVKIGFYRIAQESMNNIIKHAEADEIKISLVCEADPGSGQCRNAQMTIIDNGCGFSEEQRSSDHFGINIMKERAEAIHASISIESRIHCGTRILLVWQAVED